MVVLLLSRNPWHDIQKPSFIIIGHAMSSLNDIWNSKHLYIQTNVRVYQTLVLSLLLCKFETRTLINTKYDITQSIKLYRIISHKVSAKDPRNQTVHFIWSYEVTSRTGLSVTCVRPYCERSERHCEAASWYSSRPLCWSSTIQHLETSTWTSTCQVDQSAPLWQL